MPAVADGVPGALGLFDDVLRRLDRQGAAHLAGWVAINQLISALRVAVDEPRRAHVHGMSVSTAWSCA